MMAAWHSLLDLLVALAAPLLVAATAVLALLAHVVAKGVHRGDTGAHWARIALFTAAGSSLVLCSGWLETVWTTAWVKGWHLHWDRTPGFLFEPPIAYLLALLLPVPFWAAAAAVSALWREEDRSARWMAGKVGRSGRSWVLWCALPLVVALCWPLFRGELNAGAAGHPAAAWTVQLLLVWSLLGVAVSRPPATAASAQKTAADTSLSTEPWPAAMRRQGIGLEPLLTWPATGPQTTLGSEERLRREVESLLRGQTDKARLVLGPDDAGQIEAVALAIRRVCLAHHAALVIVDQEPSRHARLLQAHLPRAIRVAPIEVGSPAPGPSEVLVIEAEALAHRLSQVLAADELIERLHLIVWWDAHDYTGVKAANIWAVSRRFQRLLLSRRPEGVPVLVFARQAPYGQAQLSRFMRRLLPYALEDEHVIHLETRFERPVELHLVAAHRDFLAQNPTLNAKTSHPALVAALASARTGWPTHLGALADIDSLERAAMLGLQSGPGQALGDALVPSIAKAGARILEVLPKDALSLRERVATGGRLGSADSHHVAILPPRSSYVRWLLASLHKDPGFGTSRRLVCSYGNERITERHIVSALSELPDTRGRLVQTFQWEEGTLRRILDDLARREQLDQREVRFLDDADEMQHDLFYQSRLTGQGARQPLHTVGDALVEVREFVTADQLQVHMYVDRERLPIAAYPERRFMDRGRRYRVTDGEPMTDGTTQYVQCEHDENLSQTWRIRRAAVDDIRIVSGPVLTRASGGQPIGRYRLDVSYEESVTGALVQTIDPLLGPRPPRPTYYRERRTEYRAQALLIDFPWASNIQLASVAAALGSVIPVHIGVSDDALALIWVLGQQVGEHTLHGLAIVDLFPGGIGLVDAFWQEDELLLDLMRFAWRWLSECPCDSEPGCELCVRSPEALAAFPDQHQTRAAALELLGRVVGTDT